MTLQTDNEYHIDADVPGVKKDDLKVRWDTVRRHGCNSMCCMN